jgi:hypothetical protein
VGLVVEDYQTDLQQGVVPFLVEEEQGIVLVKVEDLKEKA